MKSGITSGASKNRQYASHLDEIMALCVKRGISSMTLSDGTHFSFFYGTSRSQEEIDAKLRAAIETTDRLSRESDEVVSNAQVWRTVKDGKVVDAAPLEISSEEAEEIRLGDMMVNDPAGYEQAMIDKLKNA